LRVFLCHNIDFTVYFFLLLNLIFLCYNLVNNKGG